MRIAFILSSLWLSGGVRVVVEYANRLTERGHQLTLVAPGGTVDADIRAEIDPAVTVRESRVRRADSMTAWQMARLSWSLAKAVPACDVLISTHTPTTAAGLIASRLLGRGQPVWLCQDYVEMFAGRWLENWLFRNASKWQSATLVVSEYSRRELRTYNHNAQVTVVGEGLSGYDKFRAAQQAAVTQDKDFHTLLTLGDMRPRKGMFDVEQAVALLQRELPDIRLSVFFKEEGQLSSETPVESVMRPDRAELAAMYAGCDLFVTGSWHESFGLPPLEAMACGAPVVMTDSGGVQEYAHHEENCLLVPPRKPELLAAAMLRVLTDPALADRLRAAGPRTAARYTWERSVDRFENAILDLVNPNG